MRKGILIKTFLIGVIFLFIGVVFQPAFANYNTIGNEKQQLENKFSITTNPVNPLGVTFRKTFGGTALDTGFFVQQTTDGGYIITGKKDFYPNNKGDVWLIKTDSTGNMLWDKTFGEREDLDGGECVQQTTDGGYIITGFRYSLITGERDICLIKTDSTGNKMWDKTFGGIIGYSVRQTTDGGYIIIGENGWLIKTDSIGNLVWDKKLGGYAGYCVEQTTDGGYIITGETSGSSSNAVWLIKTDSVGNKMWEKTFEKCEIENVGWYVQQTNDGGYIISGRTAMLGKGSLWLIKTDSNGNMLWDKDFLDGYGYCVQQTTDGGYIISGEIRPFFSSVYLIKTDSAGNEIWHKTFGGFGFFSGHCVQQTTDGGYIITGKSESLYDDNEDVLLIKTNKDGNIRNKAVSSFLLLKLLERFPLLQKISIFLTI
jgi:hypothetical protein